MFLNGNRLQHVTYFKDVIPYQVYLTLTILGMTDIS